MMVKRKTDGSVDKSSADQEIRISDATVITCEISGGLHLAEPGPMVGRLTKFG